MGKYSRRKTRNNGLSSSPTWMTTYADMVTLLLTFFILLFSFSSLDAAKFQAVLFSLKDALGLLEGGTTLNLATEPTALSLGLDEKWQIEQLELQELQGRLEAFINNEGLAEHVLISLEERGLVIRFLDSILFDIGSAELKNKAKGLLDKIGIELKDSSNQIRAEGHTDDLPISTYRYPSNWELSTARAASVARYLIEVGQMTPNQLSVAGYGEYRPVALNKPQGQPLNRRVDLVILRNVWASQEPGEGVKADEYRGE